MASVPFHYLDLRAFCYATEAEDRVKSALRTMLPPEPALERQESTGHHGDRIIVFSTRLERADEMRRVLDALTDAPDFPALAENVSDRIDDDCAFFVRLDKQLAYRGTVAMGTGIQLRGKVEAYPAKRARAIENLSTFLDGINTGR